MKSFTEILNEANVPQIKSIEKLIQRGNAKMSKQQKAKIAQQVTDGLHGIAQKEEESQSIKLSNGNIIKVVYDKDDDATGFRLNGKIIGNFETQDAIIASFDSNK